MKLLKKHLIAACCAALSLPLLAADFQQGLRLKAGNQLEAAAREFEGVLAQNPQDGKALEQLAVVQGWLGRYDASIATWQRLLVQEPRRDDARIGIARVQYWSGQWQASLRTLDDVLSRQPQSAEAQSLKGDVLLALQRPAEARSAYQSALQSGADAAEMNKKLARAVTPKAWRLDAGVGVDDFSNNRGTEYNGFTQLGYSFSRELSVYGRYEIARQFGSNDASYFAGAYWLPTPELLLFGEVGVTPDADFRPDSQFLVGGELLLNAYVQPLLSYRYSRYDGSSVALVPGGISQAGQVKTTTPGVRLVLPGAGNLELRLGISDNIDGSTTRVRQARVNFDAGERWAPYIAYYNGDEALPPQPPASFKVLVLGSTYQWDETWGFRADLAFEERPGFYDRTSLSVGLSYKF
ncbi:MAG: YaiO family outer membrane beta-barrel protein [Burkholderiaceae bacterium]